MNMRHRLWTGAARQTKAIKNWAVLLALAAGLITLGTASGQAQDPTPARYNLGVVPDQTVWEGSTRFLLLHWDDRTGVTMAFTASPQPQGILSLEAYNETDWILQYAPAAGESQPFTLKVTATLGAGETSQSWQMDPEPVLPPEEDFFGTDAHTQPPAVARYEVDIFDRPDPLPASLNYEPVRTVRQVRLVGETVEIEAGHANGIYEAYCDGSRRDIRSFEIIADRVIIRSPVRLKQTDVLIRARQLVFEGDGQIKTTPEERLTSAGTNGNGGLPGVDGLPAGNLTLDLGEIEVNGGGLRLDLAGGRGQPGGPGQHGSNGSNVSTRWGSVRMCDSGICKTHTPSSGYVITYYYYTFAGITAREAGTKSWPTSGTDAKPSGKPGEGGTGGTIHSTVSLDAYLTLAGGATAAATTPSSWPYDRYAGGAAGQPDKAEQVHFYLEWFSMKSSASRHTTSAGADAPVRRGNTVSGENGAIYYEDRPFAWMDPLALRKVLLRIRDDYLGNRIDAAQERLEQYTAWLADYQAHASWASLDGPTQLELTQIANEMNLLLHQLAGGLDFFGNPPAWVPMLSFEVNSTLFRNELERAMRTLYLTYWLGNKAATEQQRLEAMTTVRDALRDELEQARVDYDDAVARLPVLRTKAAALDSEIRTLQNDLQAEETRLLDSTREPDWVLGARIGLKIGAMMCQMFPFEQPAIGTLGEAFRVASDFNPDRPWDSITGIENVGSYYMNSDFEQSADDTKETKDQIDPNQAEEESFDYVSALKTAGTGLATGVEDIRGFVKEREAPSEEMLAELERLKSMSPEFRRLADEIEALMEENRQFVDELIKTMQAVAGLSNLMQRNLLAIDALNRQIAPNATVLDERAKVYLEDMEQRAFDRLVKYHYYLAKAYEYRLLKPYTEPLDLQGLINKFQEIADLNSDHEMTPAQFETLLSAYEEKLAQVAETIFDQYNSNRPELSVPIRFNLLPEEIDALNEGQIVTINLRDAGFFQPSEENVRIVDLRIAGIATEPETGSYGRTAFVDLNIAHSGISNLKLDGAIYRFRHYNRLTQNPIVWGGRYDPVDDQIDPIRPSDASDSLLRSLLSGDAVSDMLLYSRPSAWADLRISRSFFDSSGQAIRLTSVRLEMVYDFTPRNAGLGLRNLEVIVNTDDGGAGVQESTFLPYFEVGATDSNGRKDARGRFVRVFDASPSPVTVAAPAQYGDWTFAKWTDRFGRDLPGGPYTDPVFSTSVNSDVTLAAQYVPMVVGELRLEPPSLSANTLTLKWSGGPGVRLQTSPDVDDGVWEDVPGSAGQSQIEIPVSNSRAFFRLSR